MAHMKWDTQKVFILAILTGTSIAIGYNIYLQREAFSQLGQSLVLYRHASRTRLIEPTRTPDPTPKVRPTESLQIGIKPYAQPTDSQPWLSLIHI